MSEIERRVADQDCGALISKDSVHRYLLWRVWDRHLPLILFVGLNPSTADATKDDPTIRRCIGYSRGWKYGGLLMGNLFAYRATLPAALKFAIDPIGPENENWLLAANWLAETTIACWGNHGAHLNQDGRVGIKLLRRHALAVTKSGQPAHPLYMRKNLSPIAY